MGLNNQFQLILSCLTFSIIFMILYELINKITINKKGKLIKLLIELVYFNLMSICFFIIMLYINNASFNIFIILFLLIGILIYMIFLQNHIQLMYSHIFNFLMKKWKYFVMVKKQKFDIIKIQRENKKNYAKNKKPKRNNKAKKMA